MVENDKEKLERQLDRLQGRLPDRVSRAIRWLRKPSSRWVRIPLGVVLIVGGVFAFLPVLGLWMLPLGLLLLAQDVPFLRPPMLLALEWVERQWTRWKLWRRRRHR